MTDADPTAENTAAPEGVAGPSRISRKRSPARERVIRQRRRRAGALAGIAVAALVVGIVVGAATRSGGARSLHPSAPPAAHLSPIARLPGRAPGSSVATIAEEEDAAITRTLSTIPIVRMAGGQHRELALTFDDGPGPYTPQILNVLTRTHTPATFFEVGIEDRYFASSTAKIVALGDPVGDHTETHPAMSGLSRRAQRRQLLAEAAAIGNEGAPFPRMYRPPYGLWNKTTLSLLRHYRMLMVLWSVDTDDWERPGVKAIIHNALQGAKPGAIILLHDAGGDRSQTVTALPRIIRGLRRRGYRLVTVPRLLLDNPAPRRQEVATLKGTGG
jgi:peptidoglycan-N-acetylglucosamine deacetylase